MAIKRIIKNVLTLIMHPIVTIHLKINGTKDLYIAPRMTINSLSEVKIGCGVSIGRDSRFLIVKSYQGRNYSPLISIGDGTSIQNRFSALSAAPIVIDNDCLIASDVLITSENHGVNPEQSDSYASTPLDASPVHIGKGCWIGEKASIMPGVNLGERCIVAANAVVTKSFPSYSMVGGVPARLLKKYNFETHSWERILE